MNSASNFPSAIAATTLIVFGFCLPAFTQTVPGGGCSWQASTTISHIECHSSSTGSVCVSVSGSTGQFFYLWSTGATTQCISGLNSGTYGVQVVDVAGCDTSFVVTVSQPQQINMWPACCIIPRGTLPAPNRKANARVTLTRHL